MEELYKNEAEQQNSDDLPAQQDGQAAEPSPCVRTRVTVDATLQKRISRKARAVMLCLTIVGIAMLLAYIVLFVVTEEGVVLSDDFWLDFLLWVGAVFFAFGLVFFISSGRANKKQLALCLINEYEFYPDAVVINDYRPGGERVSTARLKYSDFEKIRESGEFFLLYPNRVTLYPVDKTILSAEECVTLRTLFCLPAKKIKQG